MKYASLLLLLFLAFLSCKEPQKEIKVEEEIEHIEEVSAESEMAFYETMQTHLDAISNKDLDALKSTMHPEGKMQLILPSEEITETVTAFMEFHKNWFASGDWTFETEILNTEVGPKFGMAITEAIYREPERDGEPYFNRMIVSYTLEYVDNQWYIIKDHATSAAKSTDTE